MIEVPSDGAPNAPLFSYKVKVDEIPERGLTLEIEVPEEARRAIVTAFGLVDLPQLAATVSLNKKGKEVAAEGVVRAAVTQTCVVTLDPFAQNVEEPWEVRFAPDAPALEDETAPLDAPDPIIDGTIEVGGLIVEFLALALDPYPRKPGATFQFETGEVVEHPFAALKKWTKE